MTAERSITLRHEVNGDDRRNLWARLKEDGSLMIDGQDLGPGTSIVSPDGEYEWYHTIAPEHLPQFLELIGAAPDADVLNELETNWTGKRSYELETLLRESDIPVSVEVW